MNDAFSVARLRELEDALSECVAYMKRLPLVPLTVDQIRKAQTVLDVTQPFIPLIGESYAPSGIMVLSVLVERDKATVATGSPPDRADELLRSLTRGVAVQLKTRSGRAVSTYARHTAHALSGAAQK